MTAFLEIDDVIEVKAFCTLEQQTSINVLHFKVSAITLVSATDKEAAAGLSTMLATLYKNYLPTAARYEGVHVQKINPVPAPYVFSTLNNGAGTIESDPLPSQAAMLVLKRTEVITEGARGRTFLPFWCEEQSDVDGRPTVGALALALAWATTALQTNLTITGALGTATLVPKLWSRKFFTSRDITEVKINPAWGTHKSRSQINRGDAFGI